MLGYHLKEVIWYGDRVLTNNLTFPCLFVCLERALARIPTLHVHRPVEWQYPVNVVVAFLLVHWCCFQQKVLKF